MTTDRDHYFTHRGRQFHLSKKSVEAALQGAWPERIAKYAVRVNGQEYPIRQVVALATDTPKIEWTSNEAYGILQRIGFQVDTYD